MEKMIKNHKYLSCFKDLIGLTTAEIIEKLKLNININSKNYCSLLTQNILGAKNYNELEKAGFIIKSVRLKNDLSPKEAISFPAFKFDELVNEKWNQSSLYKNLNKPFLFIFYSIEEYSLKLNCIKYWKIDDIELLDAYETWSNVKDIIKKGEIVKELKKGKRITNFPKSTKTKIIHVRPHALNANDTYVLPTIDKITNSRTYTKHSFWLNTSFIKNNVLLSSTDKCNF